MGPGPTPDAASGIGEDVRLVVAHYGVEVVVRATDGTRSRLAVPRNCSLLVGDRVRLESGTPVVLPSERVLRRRDRRGRTRSVAANLDVMGIVLAPIPHTPDAFVDRALVGARAAGIAALLVINKSDLPGASELAARMREDFSGVDPVLEVSAGRGTGLAALQRHLARGLRGVFVGVSGVGKSSLVNALVRSLVESPDDDPALAVGEINPVSGLGRHVTSNATLHALPGGGELIDTPGFRDFGPVTVTAVDLARFFPGFETALETGCHYRDCRHRAEPDCSVIAAVESGSIAAPRHAAYLALLAELEQAEQQERGY
jgi:ribosome biogenesis GTPase